MFQSEEQLCKSLEMRVSSFHWLGCMGEWRARGKGGGQIVLEIVFSYPVKAV